jgi:hypothetical protein
MRRTINSMRKEHCNSARRAGSASTVAVSGRCRRTPAQARRSSSKKVNNNNLEKSISTAASNTVPSKRGPVKCGRRGCQLP